MGSGDGWGRGSGGGIKETTVLEEQLKKCGEKNT